MKYLILLLLSLQTLFASTVQVKDGVAKVQVNADVKTYNAKDTFQVFAGDTICFIDGNGRLIIDSKRQLSNKSKTCFIVPVTNEFDLEKYLASVKDKVYVVFFDSTERVRHGVSTKGSFIEEGISEINLLKGEDLLIHSDTFGPLPVYILLINENGKVMQTISNEDQEITFVNIKSATLQNGYKIEIKNGFNQVLLKKQIFINNVK